MPAAAIIGSALIGGGLSYLGSRKQADASQQAAQTQANAANQAAQTEWNMFQTTRQDLSPWLDAGKQGLGDLSSLMQPGGALTQTFDNSKFTLDPGYNFRLSQGDQAIKQLAASKGQFYSGNMGRALDAYNQGLASNEYANAYARYMNDQNALYGRLAGLSSMGLGAGRALGGFGASAANAIGSGITGAGDALAGGYLNSANALASGYGGIANSFNQGVKNYIDYSKLF